jgi:glutathione peroxidase
VSTLYEIPVQKIDGTPAALREYAGQVLLVVNVASKCGLTPQYEGLEKLYTAQRARGLQVLGFPANNFGAQEPGSNTEIAQFCSQSYGVTFPMFAKISVGAADRHPLYRELIAAQPDPADIRWNFEKFLIGRNGTVVARFAPTVTPDDPALLAAIDAELAKPAP